MGTIRSNLFLALMMLIGIGAMAIGLLWAMGAI